MDAFESENNNNRQENQNDLFFRVLDIIDEHTVIFVVLVYALVALLIWAAYLRFVGGYGWAPWTGLGEFVSPALGQGQEYFRGRTLWDWLELLIIPIVLAGGALLFNRSARKTEREISDERVRTERMIAADQIGESALHTYLDRMTDLLLEKNLRNSEPESDVAVAARALTLTVLRGLDAQRKGILVRFLYEAHLIDRDKVVVRLSGADLSWADLSDANLSGVALHGVDLSRARLGNAHLEEADLSRSDLSYADLRIANLSRANLSDTDLCNTYLSAADLCQVDMSGALFFGTDLRGANLCHANLIRADLSSTRLSGAKLSGANLKGVNLRDTELNGVKLNGADLSDATLSLKELYEAELDFDTTMPDGSKYFPPWMKDFEENINDT
jgi:uncharacterized protein YjbI with pentapeptide repeats